MIKLLFRRMELSGFVVCRGFLPWLVLPGLPLCFPPFARGCDWSPRLTENHRWVRLPIFQMFVPVTPSVAGLLAISHAVLRLAPDLGEAIAVPVWSGCLFSTRNRSGTAWLIDSRDR